MLRATDEKFGNSNIVYISQLVQKYFGECGRGRRKGANVKQIVRGWISSGLQPELMVVDPNYLFW